MSYWEILGINFHISQQITEILSFYGVIKKNTTPIMLPHLKLICLHSLKSYSSKNIRIHPECAGQENLTNGAGIKLNVRPAVPEN